MKQSPIPPLLVELYNAMYGLQEYLKYRARGTRRPTQRYKPNGEQECARRRRQIARGQLKVSA